MIRAVIFDLDGTLIDSMLMWRGIDIRYLARFHISMPENLQKCIEGMSVLETAWYFKKTFGIEDPPEKIMADWNAMAYEEYCSKLPLKEGAEDLLRYLKERGLRIGLGTSNFRNLTEAILRARGLREYFDAVVTTEDMKKGKPAPDVYLTAARRLGVPAGECLVVEDLPAGLMAGRAAGMRTAAVYDTYSAAMSEEKKRLSDIYVQTLWEVKQYLEEENHV